MLLLVGASLSISLESCNLFCCVEQLLGVSDEDIAKEYALTMIGIDPARPILLNASKRRFHLTKIIYRG